ncbi:uncharacterized protein LOC122503668 [Leptopilina heterotoma]|uniref:uncharacterized protein LOC122503668 n=1 Tax=Leptopilina heterotoma TaxID=63436 RepID=UPI001CA99816|nr:uncharacterized protein LOC122503668 [Leptopilina heterotoma]
MTGATEFQLHGFCDASEKAYGACLYLRSSDNKGNHESALICSKSRVAPIKTETLARLKLCGATVLIDLVNATSHALQMQFSKICLWSDSTIVLNWINTSPHTLKTFVANRVSKIQKNTEPTQWRHVPTSDNPADLISRGQRPHDLLNNNFWSQGPSWLSEDKNMWPQLHVENCNIPEVRKSKPICSLKITQGQFNILDKFSTFHKLQVVIALCFRFFNNSKKSNKVERDVGQLTIAELNKAKHTILKMTQAQTFPDELISLKRNGTVDSKSSLFKLNPFLDQDLIKVGGRLEHANIPDTQKHPTVLPKHHNVTRIIIRDEHLKRHHAGAQSTLYGVREFYWIINGRNTTRHIIRQCVKCFRAKPPETRYLMGNLPKDRVSFTTPFTHVGVDYCGPFFIKEHRHRNRTKVKTYVSVFVCLATKAVHLELASDSTTDAFIACLTRFFSRRGVANSISSDNATNFVGANNEIKDLFNVLRAHEESKEV